MKIGIGGEKGGCGKTSLATNLAAALAARGHNVGLLDADPKPDASRWAERRESHPEVKQLKARRASGDIEDIIRAMGEQHDFLIVDCGGHDSTEIRYCIGFCDVFIAPFQPSVYDLDTAEQIDKIVRQGLIFNPDLKAYALINVAPTHPKSKGIEKARADLERLTSLATLEPVIHSLTVWRTTAADGLGVVDSTNEKAKADINKLLKVITGE